jgi:hypothetical protein
MKSPENPQPNLTPERYAQLAVTSLRTILEEDRLNTPEEFDDTILMLCTFKHRVESAGVSEDDRSLRIINGLITMVENLIRDRSEDS